MFCERENNDNLIHIIVTPVSLHAWRREREREEHVTHVQYYQEST